MLANSTSGYPDSVQGNPTFQALQLANVFYRWTPAQLLSYSFALPPACDPGACFHYAHTNFTVLSMVLEKVTGQSVPTLIRKRFLRPLRMRDSRVSTLPAMPQPVLHAYSRDRGVYEDSTYWSTTWGVPQILMTSTARDMITMIRALGTGKLFSRRSARQFYTSYSNGLPGAPKIGFGLGIALRDGWLFQNPVLNGYAGILGYLPKRKISILIESTNTADAAPGQGDAFPIFRQFMHYLTPGNEF
jgi:CubicO group peptidase (beta-lactamase class C family)